MPREEVESSEEDNNNHSKEEDSSVEEETKLILVVECLDRIIMHLIQPLEEEINPQEDYLEVEANRVEILQEEFSEEDNNINSPKEEASLEEAVNKRKGECLDSNNNNLRQEEDSLDSQATV